MTCDDCKNSTNVFELSNFRGRWLCCDCFPDRGGFPNRENQPKQENAWQCSGCKQNVSTLHNLHGSWFCGDCLPPVKQESEEAKLRRELGYAPLEEETVVNAAGGKQSKIAERPTLLPPRATLAVSAVLTAGAAKYGESNWHLISTNEHLDHALRHIFKYLANDATESHLSHAACRLLMALETTYA